MSLVKKNAADRFDSLDAFQRLPRGQGNSDGNMVSLDATRVTIQAIEVDFKQDRNKCPVSIEVAVDGGEAYKSRRYKEREAIRWDFNKQLVSACQFVVKVKEHHRVRSDVEVASALVKAADLYLKPVLVLDEHFEEAVSVVIHSAAAGPFIDLIRQLVKESQARLTNMKVFLERLAKVCETLNIIVSIAEPISDIHPAAGLAVAAVTQLFEFCQKQKECHKAASDLMADVASFLPFAEIPKERLKSTLTSETAHQMLVLFERISRKIIDCTADSILGALLSGNIDEVNSYKEEFLKLKEMLDWCVKTEVWRTVLKVEEQTESMVLTRLRPVMEAYYNGSSVCLEGTRKGILKAVEEWSTSWSTANLLWLHGPENSGKTTVANTVARLFDEQNRLAGCFICDRRDPSRRNPVRIIPTIAYQLAKWHKAYRGLVAGILLGAGELDLNVGLELQFRRLVEEPLAGLLVDIPPKHKPLIMVLDALDECCETEESRCLLACYIVKLAAVAPWLKIFVSSKKTVELETDFGREGFQVLGMGDRNFILQEDIAAYAEYLVQEQPDYKLELKYRSSTCLARILKELQLSLSMMSRDSSNILRGTTSQSRLDAFVWKILHVVQDCDEETKKLIRDILAILACISIQGPPSEDLLLHFLQLLWPINDVDLVRSCIKAVYPIIFRSASGSLYLVLPQPLFLEFIANQQQSSSLRMDIVLLKKELAKCCFEVLHSQLKFNVYNIDSSHTRNDESSELSSRRTTRISEILQYSSLRWMDHASQAYNTSELRRRAIDLLSSAQALYWIEVLSLLGALEVGKGALLKCAEHFKGNGEVVHAATELHKFITDFSAAMEVSTPHIYVSAPLWQAKDSFVRKTCFPSFQHSLLATEEHFPGSNRARYLRDSDLAKHIENAWCIACSPDKNRIATGGSNRSLRIFNGQSGQLIIEVVKCHEDWIRTLAFSPDGTRIVTGSGDATLRIWNSQNGDLVGSPLKGHTHWVTSVAYSSDGLRVASGSWDIRIWDAQTGAPLGKPFEGHKSYICAVAFSPDNRRLVSGSWDRTVRIWEVGSGTLVHTLEGHENYVRSVVYSPDGLRVVSGSDDKTLRIWNAQDGSPIGLPLEGHEGLVADVKYSDDSSRVISWPEDGTLRFWDATSGAPLDVMRRGENRWDTDNNCFVAMPDWWRKRVAPPATIFDRSDSPLQVPDDGWLRTLGGGLFVWVPPKYRDDVCGPNPRLKINWKNVRHGRDWTKIMDDVEGDVIAAEYVC